MKKKMIILLVVLSLIIPLQAEAKTSKYRTMTGTYYNYMCIVTKDGNEWLLSDYQSKKNLYMVYNKKSRCYMPIFKPGQKVKVKFDTRGTKRKTDDRIIKVTKVK